MKLSDLNPEWHKSGDTSAGTRGKYLEFDCPRQHDENDMRCRVVIPVNHETGTTWQSTGEDFNTITISPSIWHHCSLNPHFFMRNGEIVYA